jgi:heptosyltransferase-2
MAAITSKDYDRRVSAEGLEFQAATYYEPVDPSALRRIEAVLSAVGAKPAEKILDIGCGVGTFAYRCSKLGAFSAGVDYSLESIRAARALSVKYGTSDGSRFFVGNAVNLPIKGAYFDKVVSADFIEHITDSDKERMLAEMRRVLKPEGEAVIFTPNGIREMIGALYRRARHIFFGERMPETELHFGLTTKRRFERLCKKLGFTCKLYYHDTTRPYLAKIPVLRPALALNLLWVIKSRTRSILVINLGGIGDALLSTPALRSLKERYPEAAISVLASEASAEVFRRLDFIADVKIMESARGGYYIAASWRNMLTALKLRSAGFDIAINMRTLYSRAGALKMRALMAAIRPGLSVGRNTDGRGDFLGIGIPETNAAEKYEMDYDIETVERLGAKVTDTRIDIPIDESDRAAAKRLMELAGISGGDVLIGIHPGGKPSRRLPAECFASVLKNLSKTPGRKFVITGDASEAALAEDIIEKSGVSRESAVNASGALPLGATAGLIGRCGLYISNDTANMHIAAALKTPLVAIFGPGNLTRFDPRRISEKADVVYHKVSCAPCENMVCEKPECMRSVSAEEVTAAAEALLKRQYPRGTG